MAPHLPQDHGNLSPTRPTISYDLLRMLARSTNNWRKQAREARGTGCIVIIGGDMNTSIKHTNATHLIGKWASHKEGTYSES